MASEIVVAVSVIIYKNVSIRYNNVVEFLLQTTNIGQKIKYFIDSYCHWSGEV